MHITWLTSGGLAPVNGRPYSPLASERYRVLVPARLLRGWGYAVSVVPAGCPADAALWNEALAADLVVVSKVFSGAVLRVLERARGQGARILVDLCDNHFDTPELGGVYTELCSQADALTVSTASLGELIAERFGRFATVIDDPYEAPLAEARFAPSSPSLKLVWFGSPTNFDTCELMIPRLAQLSRTLPLALQVVTDALDGAVPARLAELAAEFGGVLPIEFIGWSVERTWAAIVAADLVVIPSLDDLRKQVKGPNRLVDSLRCGRFVIAYPLPAYQPLGQYAWLGKDLAAGIRWAVENPAAVLARLQAGQRYVAARFAPELIGRAWENALRQVCAEADSPRGRPAAVFRPDGHTAGLTMHVRHGAPRPVVGPEP